MEEELLVVERLDQGVVRLWLNRPDQRNALSSELRRMISQNMDELSVDDSVKAILLMAKGPVFCAGFDLKELAGGHSDTIFAEARAYHNSVYTCSKPLLVAIDGPAYAGGMDLTAMCDIRLGTETAVFAQPQVKLGVPAAFDLVKTVLPETLARDLCLSGRKMGAKEALECGYLSELVPSASLESRAIEKATELALAGAAITVKLTIVNSQPSLFRD